MADRAGSAKAGLLVAVAVAMGLGLAFMAGAFDGLLGPGDRGGAVSDQGDAPEDPAPPAEAPVAKAPETAAPAPAMAATPRGRGDASRWNDEGLEALEREEFDRAVDLFGRARAAEPDEDAFAHNLTEAHVRRGLHWPDTQAALAVADFESALEHVVTAERRVQIEAMLARARSIAEAEEDFVVESTLHFTFRFDGARPELLDGIDALKNVLEETYQEYGELFRRRPVEEGEPRIEVVLYGAEGFDRVTGLGDWAGGVFDGTIRVPVKELDSAASVARLTAVLRHETAHAFTRSIGGTEVPAWLGEGVAQWLEDPARRAFDVRMARGRLAASGAELFPLADLTGTIASWTDRARIRRAYDQSLGFTAFLHATYGEDLLYEMVGACKSGGAAGAGSRFREVILLDLETVSADFAEDLRRGR